MNIYAIIMAGGGGTRFWPLSRKEVPKQFLNLSGKELMINETIDRITGVIPKQYYLSNIMDSPHAGFYFATDAKRHPMKIEGSRMYARYIENDETAPASSSSIHRYSLLLESVLTAPDSQFVCMDNSENPIFAEPDKSEEYTGFILSIQAGVLEFAEDFFEMTGDLIFECPMNRDVYEELIRLVVEEDVVSEDLKNKFVMEDNFCTDECINVFDRLSENLRD